jgi:hypothetical protein
MKSLSVVLCLVVGAFLGTLGSQVKAACIGGCFYVTNYNAAGMDYVTQTNVCIVNATDTAYLKCSVSTNYPNLKCTKTDTVMRATTMQCRCCFGGTARAQNFDDPTNCPTNTFFKACDLTLCGAGGSYPLKR